MPEYGLAAGSTGTVVVDHTKLFEKDLPPACEVEFLDEAGITLAVVTLSGDDLEVVWRPDAGSR